MFVEFSYETVSGSWSRARRVVAKAEHIDGKENPRYVVTSLAATAWPAQKLYEELYCARGDMENRIKEQFTLFADRASQELRSREALAPVFADLNQYAATMHFLGQTTILTLTDEARGELIACPITSRSTVIPDA